MKPKTGELKYYGRLTAHDLNGVVTVQHSDGSFFYFNNAFYTDEHDDFWVVYSEHNGYHAFARGDIDRISGAHRGSDFVPLNEKVDADI